MCYHYYRGTGIDNQTTCLYNMSIRVSLNMMKKTKVMVSSYDTSENAVETQGKVDE